MRRHNGDEVPAWPPDPARTRIVIEDGDGASAWATANILQAAGFETLVCGGPETRPRHQCPLVREGRCALVEEADAVYCALRFSSDENRAVVGALKSQHPGLPMVVEATPSEVKKLGHQLDGCTVVSFPPLRSTILDAVDGALGSRTEATVD